MKIARYASTVSAVLWIALAIGAPAQENAWMSHGPTGAGVTNDVAVGDGVAYAATPTGVFRSRDGGATWTQTTLAGEWIVQVVACPEAMPAATAVGEGIGVDTLVHASPPSRL